MSTTTMSAFEDSLRRLEAELRDPAVAYHARETERRAILAHQLRSQGRNPADADTLPYVRIEIEPWSIGVAIYTSDGRYFGDTASNAGGSGGGAWRELLREHGIVSAEAKPGMWDAAISRDHFWRIAEETPALIAALEALAGDAWRAYEALWQERIGYLSVPYHWQEGEKKDRTGRPWRIRLWTRYLSLASGRREMEDRRAEEEAKRYFPDMVRGDELLLYCNRATLVDPGAGKATLTIDGVTVGETDAPNLFCALWNRIGGPYHRPYRARNADAPHWGGGSSRAGINRRWAHYAGAGGKLAPESEWEINWDPRDPEQDPLRGQSTP